jgi:hypothetical protein
VAAVNLAREIRPALLLDPDPSWAIPRLLLDLGFLAGSAAAGVALAGVFMIWAKTRVAREPLPGLPLRPTALALLAAAAIVSGAALRWVGLDRVPWPVFIDESSFIAPALQLEGRWCDFRDSIRVQQQHEWPASHSIHARLSRKGAYLHTAVATISRYGAGGRQVLGLHDLWLCVDCTRPEP